MLIYNALNYPAGVLPMTRVTEEDVQNMVNYPTKDSKHLKVKQVILDSGLFSSSRYCCIAPQN